MNLFSLHSRIECLRTNQRRQNLVGLWAWPWSLRRRQKSALPHVDALWALRRVLQTH